MEDNKIYDTEEFDQTAAFAEASDHVMGRDTFIEDTVDDDDSEQDRLDTEDEETSEDENIDESEVSEEEQSALDYKALYGQVAARNAALQSNLEAVSQQFRSWQGRVEAEKRQTADTEKEKPAAKDAKPEIEMTPELEEFFELYPGVIPQVQKLIDSRVSTEVSGVEERVAQLIEQQVKPIASRVQESEVQAHESAILEAHPDIREQIASGAFRSWVETLPTYQQIGAQQICESGSASEVIDLFSNFKQNMNVGSATTKSPTNKKTQSTGANNAKRLKDALGVASEPTRVSDGNLQGGASSEDLASIFARAEKKVLQENAF